MTNNQFQRVRPYVLAVLVTGASILPAAVEAQTGAGSRVLVMPFAADVEAQAPGGAGTSLWLGEAAALLLGEGLAAQGVGALTREERLVAFDRLQLPMSAALTRATMIRVAELTGATDLVFGDVELGTELRARVRVIHVGPGAERPSVEDAAPLEDIFALFDRIASRVANVTGRVVDRSSATIAPLPLEAFEAYVKGLVAATPPVQQRFLESAIRLAPTDARILMALWSVYSAQEFHDKALGAANSVTEDSRHHRRARYAVAQSLTALKRFDGAFQTLEELYSAQPSATISNALGIVQLRRGVPETAGPPTLFFARAVKEAVGNSDYLFNLGYAHALAGSNSEAIPALREAVRFDPADGDAHFVMSVVLGRTPEGLRELELARSLGTSLEPGLLVPGGRVPPGLERVDLELEVSASRPGPAVARRDQQENAAFHLARARDLVAAGRDTEAIEALRRAIYLSPYVDEPHLLLGTLYRRAGRLSEAIDAFKVALWSRETAAAQVALGSALLESGDRDGARLAAERALVLAPTSNEARELLKRLGG